MQFTKFLPNQGGRTKVLSGFVQRRSTMLFLMRVSVFYVALISGSIQLSLASSTSGQKLDETYVTVELNHESLQTLFEKIEKQTNLLFTFPEGMKSYNALSLASGRRSVKETLDMVLKDTPVTYKQINGNLVAVFVGEESGDSKESIIVKNDKSVVVFALITGTVKDASTQEPLAGVNVIVKGTVRGTTSDAFGKFIIDAEENETLVFSFIGYTTQETVVNGRTLIDIQLNEDVTSLQEVTVNAWYWNVKEKERTGNISKITAEEIASQPVSNPLATLQGRMPGVSVTQLTGVPGGNFEVRIRGRNSIASGNDPFYVIDGVPFISDPLSSSITSVGILGFPGASPLNSINPNDIESIEVLKDADATAIYGSRGANGVILITTKKGKAGKTKIDLNLSTGASKVGHKVDLMNTNEYLGMRREAIKNDNAEAYIPILPFLFYDLVSWDSTRYTDWQKELIGGTAKTTTLQASISGGTSNTQFSFRGGYNRQGTVFPGEADYQKWSANFSVSHQSPNQKFKSTFSGSYVADRNSLPHDDLTSQALVLAPNAPSLYNDIGELNWENSTWVNPIAYLNQKFQSNSNNFIGNVLLSYEIIHGLEVKTNFGFNDIRQQDMSTYPSTFYDPASGNTPASASSRFNTSSRKSWILEPQLSWNKKIGNGNLSILSGLTFQDQRREQLTQQAVGFSSDELIEDIGAAADVGVFDFIKSQYRYNAIFGRINYVFNEKYILNLTGRRDGSSRFGPGKQFANFGAIGAAWLFSNESFIQENFSFISYGKLRTSYGSSGNDQIGDYAFLDTYTSGGLYQGVKGIGPTKLYNPDFAWELNRKFEAGFELGFLEDKFILSGSFYKNRSSNQLVNYTLPGTTGFSSIRQNFPATVENKGWELELRTKNFQNSKLKWTASVNMTIPSNKLIEFPGLESSTYRNTYVVGKSLGIRKMYHYIGVDPETGVYKMADMSGDNVVNTSDRLSIQQVGQQYYGGVSNNFSYGGWHLDIFVQVVKQTAPGYFFLNSNLPGTLINMPKSILNDRWMVEGDVATIQQFSTGFKADPPNAFALYNQSDDVIVDASFIRVKNVSLSYDFPQRWTKGVNARLYFQGQNLLTFTNYEGLDPENTSQTALPPLRTVTMGVQVSF